MHAPGVQLDNEVSQSTDQPHGTVCHQHYTVTGPVGQRLQTGTEDAPVLDRPAQLRRLHDSGAGYKYPDLGLLACLLYQSITFDQYSRSQFSGKPV